ncbi:MAG: hypothetical protein V4607_15400 [Pseudomonadota bacterium]
MSSENEQSIRVERAVKSAVLQKSSVIQMHAKNNVTADLPIFDAEYHAAGFCSCCTRGE